MLVVGLTGGIGSGKTQASNWFAKQNIHIIDVDVLARQVVEKNSPALQQIVQAFGEWVIQADGLLNRKALREYIFTHPDALITLQNITHPAIRALAKQQIDQATTAYCILVAPLLLEGGKTGLKQLCQQILVIDTDEHNQILRASLRDKQTTEQIQAIMNNQLSRKQRLQQADHVVTNNGTLEQLYAKLIPLHQYYLTLAKQF
ncbi:dephospho-CoA kinase [Moraxella macacae 0408225]|uniref:Dephospho-CoA kinase n=1 Tax=Moraxella macacae 0408225 TaxID=1230338 RepID=L2F718_9GAMM|nr:dephospho-CoA kinase [Moraxella macacae]ELA08879.1 dephospho-CoA kinase [Moraxella macacae 0408225]